MDNFNNGFNNNAMMGGMPFYGGNQVMGGGYAMPGGQMYNVNPNFQRMEYKDTLTQAESELLKTQPDSFNLMLTDIEAARSRCPHVHPNGQLATRDNHDGTCTCDRCGTTFSTQGYTIEEIISAVNVLTDTLNLTKIMYPNVPVETQRDFYQIIALLPKIPKFFEIAFDFFNKSDNAMKINPFDATGNAFYFQALNNMINPMGGMGAPMTPWGAQPMNNGYGVPNAAPMQGGMNPAFQGNPLGNFGGTAVGQQMMPGYGVPNAAPMPNNYVPQQGGYQVGSVPVTPDATQAAPSTPAPSAPTAAPQEVAVNGTMKA